MTISTTSYVHESLQCEDNQVLEVCSLSACRCIKPSAHIRPAESTNSAEAELIKAADSIVQPENSYLA